MKINYNLTKRTTKTKKFKKFFLKTIKIINFKVILYKLTALSKTIYSIFKEKLTVHLSNLGRDNSIIKHQLFFSISFLISFLLVTKGSRIYIDNLTVWQFDEVSGSGIR